MDAVDEEDFRKLFGYVTLVGIELSLDLLQEGLVLQWIAVIGVAGGDDEIQYLAFLVASPAEFQSTPPQGGRRVPCPAFVDCIVRFNPRPRRGGAT